MDLIWPPLLPCTPRSGELKTGIDCLTTVQHDLRLCWNSELRGIFLAFKLVWMWCYDSFASCGESPLTGKTYMWHKAFWKISNPQLDQTYLIVALLVNTTVSSIIQSYVINLTGTDYPSTCDTVMWSVPGLHKMSTMPMFLTTGHI